MGDYHAMLTGTAYGLLHIFGPDHLGTLATLCTVMAPSQAFRVGATWGLGHCVGMLGVAAIFFVLDKALPVSAQAWGHFGDYLIGISMILLALYFIAREREYVEVLSDGSATLQPCACHAGYGGVGADEEVPGGRAEDRCGDCASSCEGSRPSSAPALRQGKAGATIDPFLLQGEGEHAKEGEPLLPARPPRPDRDVKGAALGLFQGLCCPIGVIGSSFLASLRPPAMAAFLLIFLAVYALGTAVLAMAWAYLTGFGIIGGRSSPKAVYRCSCGLTMLIGWLFIAATFFGHGNHHAHGHEMR